MGLFSSSSSSTSTSIRTSDDKISSGENSDIQRLDFDRPSLRDDASIKIGSDEVALASLSSANQNFELVSELLGQSFEESLNAQSESAQQNTKAAFDLAGSLVQKEQEEADDSLIKIIYVAAAAGIGIFAIQQGVFS